MRVAAIEGGGTKFVAAVGSPASITEQCTRIATTTPDETLPQLLDYLRAEHKKNAFSAIGIGSFGPLGIDPNNNTYGVIGPTTKPHWENVNFTEEFAEFQVPVAVTTDVNAAALAESILG